MSWGMEPMCDNGLQKVEIVANVVAGENCKLSLDNTDYILDKDFHPFSFSENGELKQRLFLQDMDSNRF